MAGTQFLKTYGKRLIVVVLGWQIRRFQRSHRITTIGIVGSYGKTSTKFAIATVLGSHLRVQFQKGNYNDIISVPLIFFGQAMPNLFNPFAWLRIFLENEKHIRRPYAYDVVILELGTDGPGQIAAFKKYLHLDLAIVTALAYEHMEFFTDLDAVATEELSVSTLSKRVVFNADLCAERYTNTLSTPVYTYGLGKADYALLAQQQGNTTSMTLTHSGKAIGTLSRPAVATPHLYSLCAAATVATILEVPNDHILQGLKQVSPPSGRMQMLEGIKDSLIIDDTYNASPEAVEAALNELYAHEAPQRIAVLGNMNELGAYSADAHQAIGASCDPRKLAAVITLGPDANRYLAPAAQAAGCTVVQFNDPYAVGVYLRKHIQPHAIVLVKGSQNKVFAEEAIKFILAHAEDEQKLVRQSRAWLAKKARNFPQATIQA